MERSWGRNFEMLMGTMITQDIDSPLDFERIQHGVRPMPPFIYVTASIVPGGDERC